MSSCRYRYANPNNPVVYALILLLLLKLSDGDGSSSSNSSSASNDSNPGTNFTEQTFYATTNDSVGYSTPFNTSQQSLASIFVTNIGTSNVFNAALEISPDDSKYIRDSLEYSIAPGEMRVFVPKIYAKYVRIAFNSSMANLPASIKIIYQSKT